MLVVFERFFKEYGLFTKSFWSIPLGKLSEIVAYIRQFSSCLFKVINDRYRQFSSHCICKKWAVIEMLPVMVILAGFVVPVRSPLQPVKDQPGSAVAVSVTGSL